MNARCDSTSPSKYASRVHLVLSLNRGLWGEVHPELRQASIEADESTHIVKVRFEFDGVPSEIALESCSCATTECIADFPSPWNLDEQYVTRPFPEPLEPLRYIVYHRYESDVAQQTPGAV